MNTADRPYPCVIPLFYRKTESGQRCPECQHPAATSWTFCSPRDGLLTWVCSGCQTRRLQSSQNCSWCAQSAVGADGTPPWTHVFPGSVMMELPICRACLNACHAGLITKAEWEELSKVYDWFPGAPWGPEEDPPPVSLPEALIAGRIAFETKG
jgi:hypothetical protein